MGYIPGVPSLDQVLSHGNRTTRNIEIDGSIIRLLSRGSIEFYPDLGITRNARIFSDTAYRFWIEHRNPNLMFRTIDPPALDPGALFHDDFYGDSIDAKWATTVTGTGSIVKSNTANGYVDMQTGATAASTARLHFAGALLSRRQWRTYLEFRFSLSVVSGLSISVGLAVNDYDPVGNPAAGNHCAVIKANGGQTNFFAGTRGVAYSEVDTGVAMAAGTIRDYCIEVDTTEVRFWIGESLVVTKTTDLPGNTFDMQPYVGIQNTDAVNKLLNLDFVSHIGGRL